MRLNFFKEYVFSLKFFILAASAVFIFAVFQGYFTAQSSPSEMAEILTTFREMLDPVIEMPPPGQFLFVVLNNGLTAFLAVLLGLAFGIFPFLVLLANGFILGVAAYFSIVVPDFGVESWSIFLTAILPHGIIEIPVIILACAVGFKLGKTLLFRILKKEGSIKSELNTALGFFLKFLFPLLVLAAAIEIFVTVRLL